MSQNAMLTVSIDHPSLAGSVETFLRELRSEKRYFGRAVQARTKPFPSLINRLGDSDGTRVGAFEDGRLVGLAKVDHDSIVTVAVSADRRDEGIGGHLLRTLLERARDHGHTRVVLPVSRRSDALLAVADELGALVVELGRGRVDLIFEFVYEARPA
jgi:GNAT superfamily N-acetyltransferase